MFETRCCPSNSQEMCVHTNHVDYEQEMITDNQYAR